MYQLSRTKTNLPDPELSQLLALDETTIIFNELINLEEKLKSLPGKVLGLKRLKKKTNPKKNEKSGEFDNKENTNTLNLNSFDRWENDKQNCSLEKEFSKNQNASTSTRDTFTSPKVFESERAEDTREDNILYMCLTPIKKLSSKENFQKLQNFKQNTNKPVFSYFNKELLIPRHLLNEIHSNLIFEEKSESGQISQLIKNYNSVYSTIQAEINEKMRAVLIDWLIEVHDKFKLVPETLFLTVRVIDIYLSFKKITANKLQLLGVTSLWLACKYEEMLIPLLKDCVFVTDNAYTEEDLIEMEMDILKTLSFQLTFPSISIFYDIYSINFGFEDTHYYIGRYFLDLFLLDNRVNKYMPSLIAMSAVYLVMKLHKDKFTHYSLLKYFFEHDEKILKECAADICYLHENILKTNFQSVNNKYSSEVYLRVIHSDTLKMIKSQN